MCRKGTALAIIEPFGTGFLLNGGDFLAALSMYGEFAGMMMRSSFCDGEPKLHQRLKKKVEDIVQTVESANNGNGIQAAPVFLVAPADYVTKRWFKLFRQVLEKKLPGTPIYAIVFGGYFQGDAWRDREVEPYDGGEVCAHEAGCVKLFYNSDAISNGIHRLVEFMNRVMGCDLPDDEFPNYSFEELKKIAWNISRESFNAMSVREGSIPKYPISRETRRPVYPF